VWEPEETDRYLILKASVKSRGTHVLLGYRANAGGLDHVRWDEESAGFSRRQFEAKFWLCPGKLGPVQEYLLTNSHLIEGVLRQTKARRYETSPAWSEGVPFFLCGGGRMSTPIGGDQKNGTKWRCWRCSYHGRMVWCKGKLAPQRLHRVSVAHGLSYSKRTSGRLNGSRRFQTSFERVGHCGLHQPVHRQVDVGDRVSLTRRWQILRRLLPVVAEVSDRSETISSRPVRQVDFGPANWVAGDPTAVADRRGCDQPPLVSLPPFTPYHSNPL